MMNQPKFGEVVKNVLGRSVCTWSILRAPLRDVPHAIRAQRECADERHHERADRRQQRARDQIARWHLRLARQSIHLRLIDQQKERVEAAEWSVRIGTIETRAGLTLLAKLYHS